MASTPKNYAGGTVTGTTISLPWRELSFPLAISRALTELRDQDGRKALAPNFDGRDGREVAETTVSRWITEPHRFPAHCLPVLVALHPAFRQFLFEHLAARMVAPAEIVKGLSKTAAAEYEKLLADRFLDMAYGPGRKGEHYA